jgi:hypothetical protein
MEIKKIKGQGMVAYICNPNSLEGETGRLPVQGQPGLHAKILSQN